MLIRGKDQSQKKGWKKWKKIVGIWAGGVAGWMETPVRAVNARARSRWAGRLVDRLWPQYRQGEEPHDVHDRHSFFHPRAPMGSKKAELAHCFPQCLPVQLERAG